MSKPTPVDQHLLLPSDPANSPFQAVFPGSATHAPDHRWTVHSLSCCPWKPSQALFSMCSSNPWPPYSSLLAPPALFARRTAIPSLDLSSAPAPAPVP